MKALNLNLELSFSGDVSVTGIDEVIKNVTSALQSKIDNDGISPDESDVFTEKISVKTARNFTNGFSSWIETFYEMTQAITMEISKDVPTGTVNERHEAQGHGGLYELSEELTDKFELKYKDVEWGSVELEWWDAIDAFVKEELYPDGM